MKPDAPHGRHVRRPISLKIFSIALGLLGLMAIVATLSARNLRQVNQQLKALADYYIPLSHSVTTVEIDVRQQVIHLERLILLQQGRHTDLAALKREKMEFDNKSGNVEEEIAAALRVAAEALVAAQGEADRLELARLEPEIRDVLRAHRHLRDSVLQFLDKVKQGDQQAVPMLHSVIAEERQLFDAEVRDVRRELQKFTEGAAEKAEALEQAALKLNWSLTLAAGLFGLLFAAVLTRNLVRPIRRLLQGTRAVEQGSLNVHLHVTSKDEIAALTESFNHMVVELRQKELIKDTFGKYVDPRIVRGLLEDRQFAKEGERRVMTVLFSDLQGFTSLAERLTPDGVVKFLNQFFTMMSEPIRHYNGILDKYIGDAVMAFWGPPFTSAREHPTLACLAALEQRSQLERFRQIVPEILGLRTGLPPINMRVGLSTGEVTVGNIGSTYSKGYTVIGDTVNLASRLETANKQYGTTLLMSEATWRMTREAVETRELDNVRVVGKSEPVRLFELLAPKGKLSEADQGLRDRFEQGLTAYRTRDWSQAAADFERCLQINPEDRPSKVFLGRVTYLQEHPPENDWDGVWRLTEK